MDKQIVYRVEDGMDRSKVLCTTYQMRNFYSQFRDGFFTNLDVMNYPKSFFRVAFQLISLTVFNRTYGLYSCS